MLKTDILLNTLNRPPEANPPLLTVRDLTIQYETPKGPLTAVNHIGFSVQRGETLGLVGESGSGKSTIAMGILRLIQAPGRIVSGSVQLDNEDLLALNPHDLRDVRWRKLALVPQGAMNSLNPVMTVGTQLGDGIVAHESTPRYILRERLIELLDMVGLPDTVLKLYPHELSGGMKQRVCIAMAVALDPMLIIADEPTSALDVVTQRVVAQTLRKVKDMSGVSMILIGHDMGLQAQLADRVAVMYAGNIVEIAPVLDIFQHPMHPYTQLLIQATPSIKGRKSLKVTEGAMVDLRKPPPGCIFQYRCPAVMDSCRAVFPPLRELAPEHWVACHLYDDQRGTHSS